MASNCVRKKSALEIYQEKVSSVCNVSTILEDDEIFNFLICPICQDQYEAPIIQCQWGHSFCYRCLEQWMTKKPNCPSCRKPLEKNTICRNLILEQAVDELVEKKFLARALKSSKPYTIDHIFRPPQRDQKTLLKICLSWNVVGFAIMFACFGLLIQDSRIQEVLMRKDLLPPYIPLPNPPNAKPLQIPSTRPRFEQSEMMTKAVKAFYEQYEASFNARTAHQRRKPVDADQQERIIDQKPIEDDDKNNENLDLKTKEADGSHIPLTRVLEELRFYVTEALNYIISIMISKTMSCLAYSLSIIYQVSTIFVSLMTVLVVYLMLAVQFWIKFMIQTTIEIVKWMVIFLILFLKTATGGLATFFEFIGLHAL